jgi:hypothetical protein
VPLTVKPVSLAKAREMERVNAIIASEDGVDELMELGGEDLTRNVGMHAGACYRARQAH